MPPLPRPGFPALYCMIHDLVLQSIFRALFAMEENQENKEAYCLIGSLSRGVCLIFKIVILQ